MSDTGELISYEHILEIKKNKEKTQNHNKQ